MGKKTTEIICILDRSGSMGGLATEVINSFNNFITEQKEVKGKAKVTLVLFDDQYDLVLDRVKLNDVPELTEATYFARGMTAMNDAIGRTIKNVKEGTNKAIVLIQTDGYENASHEYTNAQIKVMVKEKEDGGWNFVFLGANIDTVAEGGLRGFDKSFSFDNNARGVQTAYASMSASTVAYRSGGDVAESLADNLVEDNKADTNSINLDELNEKLGDLSEDQIAEVQEQLKDSLADNQNSWNQKHGPQSGGVTLNMGLQTPDDLTNVDLTDPTLK